MLSCDGRDTTNNFLVRKNPRTACADDSVWLRLPEDLFRRHLLILEQKVGAVADDPQIFPSELWLSRTPSLEKSYGLPLDVEQQTADDFAFLAAVEEGAQSVAAVCIEEDCQQPGMTLRFAAMDVVRNGEVKATLRSLCDSLSRVAATTDSLLEHIDVLFQDIIKLHYNRLLARLRSKKWQKPRYLSKSHKKPLWKDFENLIHRVQFLYTKKEKQARQLVESKLQELAMIYEDFEDSAEELESLMHLVDASLSFSSAGDIKNFAQRIQSSPKSSQPTRQIQSAVKSLQQIQKISSCRRICISLVNFARQYSTLFQNISIEYLIPYDGVPTSIGFHEWARTCHVHAEVHLAIYYDLNPDRRPRCIGTSKWLCYLCFQYLSADGRFFPSKTHGVIYDQWTIPDLVEFNGSLVQKYRSIMAEIDMGIQKRTNEETGSRKLQRMTSYDFDELGRI